MIIYTIPQKYKPNGGEKLKYVEVKRLREEADMTQSELGQRIGLSKSTICGAEKGVKPLTGDAIVELTKVFNCTADEILGLKKG